MKKISFFSLLTAIVCTSTLFAMSSRRHDYNGQPNHRRYECEDEPPPPPPPFCIVPTARGCPGSNGIFFDLEFLYWTARNEAFGYGLNVNGFNFATGAVLDSNLLRVSEDWEPGLRVSMGWNSGYDDWDFVGRYTYYHNHSTDTTTATAVNSVLGTGLGIFPIWLGIPTTTNVGSAVGFARGKYRLNYNIGDIEWGRAMFFSKWLSFRPHLGVRVAFLYQDFRVNYDNPANFNQRIPGVFVGNSNFWGAGPRIGVDGKWHMGWGFNFFGNISTALIYGKIKSDAESRQVNSPNVGVFNTTSKYSDDFAQLVPTMQMLMGLEWGDCFCDWFFLGLSVGWEVNYWWNQMHLPQMNISSLSPTPNLYTKPLTLLGLTAKLELDF